MSSSSIIVGAVVVVVVVRCLLELVSLKVLPLFIYGGL